MIKTQKEKKINLISQMIESGKDDMTNFWTDIANDSGLEADDPQWFAKFPKLQRTILDQPEMIEINHNFKNTFEYCLFEEWEKTAEHCKKNQNKLNKMRSN